MGNTFWNQKLIPLNCRPKHDARICITAEPIAIAAASHVNGFFRLT